MEKNKEEVQPRPLFKSFSDPNTASIIERYNISRLQLLSAKNEIESLKTRTFFTNQAALFKEKQLTSARNEILELFAENERLKRDNESIHQALLTLQKNNNSNLGKIKDMFEENTSLHNEVRRNKNSEILLLTHKDLIDYSFDTLAEICIILGVSPLDIPSGPEFILNNKIGRTQTPQEIKDQYNKLQRIIVTKIKRISEAVTIEEPKYDFDISVEPPVRKQEKSSLMNSIIKKLFKKKK